MRLQHKSFPVTAVKTLDEAQGIVEAIVSVFGLEDLGGERVLPGFFAESLARRKPYGCVFHDWNRPVAKTLAARELSPGDPLLTDENREYGGLYVKGHYNLDTQDGRETFSNIQAGILDQFSIGYTIEEEAKGKDGVRELKKGTLYEWSPVLWGMNPATSVISAKGLAGKAVYLGEYAAEEMTLAALRDCCDSLFYRVIYDVLFDYDGERSADEKITTIDAAIMEFHALSVACLKAMLTAAEGDDGEMEAEYKQIFSRTARTAGRFDRQLLALLTEVESAKHRADEIVAFRQEQGRPLFSPERHGQLKALSEALLGLVETTAHRPEVLDTSLLQRQAAVELERLKLALACGGV